MKADINKILLRFWAVTIFGLVPIAGQTQTNGTAIWWGDRTGGGGSNELQTIAAGSTHDLAIKSDGTVVAWGSNAAGETAVPAGLNGVVAIAAGGNLSLAVRSNGQLVAWGANSDGQATVPAGLSNVVGVAAGNVHSVALRSDGTVVAWGYNGQGQCTVPTGLNGVSAIASRGYNVLALKSNGTVVAWGDNAHGESTVPAGLNGVVAIAAGGEHGVALRSNGMIVAWGNNTYGQCAAPTNQGPFIGLGAGWYHTLGLKADHTVVAWGAGTNQTGYPHVGQSIVPAGLRDVVAVAGGTLHSLVLTVEPPRLEVSPSNQTVVAGSPVDFSVVAGGAPPLRYHWFFNETNVLLVGPSPTLHLTDVQPAQSGAYTVVITNKYGAVTSAPAILTVATAPVIVAHPTNLTVAIDDPADFYVSAVGSSLAYQWYFGGTGAIAGATRTVYHIDQAQFAQTGEYTVVITNVSGAVTSTPALLTVRRREGVVTNCTEAALRAAMAFGGNVTFACDGLITLSDTITNNLALTLDGAGHNVTLSGGGALRLFFVPSNSVLTLRNLTCSGGRAIKGGGIFNDAGNLTLSGVTMIGNSADQVAELDSMFQTGEGGALFNRNGVVNADKCSFINNAAYQRPDDFPSSELKARGGAIRNLSGTVSLQDCQFIGNFASGGPTMGPMYYSRDASGGAIDNSGTLMITRSSFWRNIARGEPTTITIYPGFAGGAGRGGAVFNDGWLALQASTIASNSVSGGSGGVGSPGCADCPGYPAYPGGTGGNGGSAYGAGLFNAGTASAENCTFAWNSCAGGNGGQGGNGGPAHFHGLSGTDGGNGGEGGSSFGAGIHGSAYLTNCTLAFNFVMPGAGGAGGMGGPGMPPGVSGQPGAPGATGAAGGSGLTGGFLVNTLLATNAPGGNTFGTIGDGGYNLSSDNSCNFTNTGSVNNTNPKLGPLADNGGPTPTLALLPGSPAVDAAPLAGAPATDQRGVSRPRGSAPDIGAVELAPSLRIAPSGGGWEINLSNGQANQACCLMTSTNLLDWQAVVTNQTGPDGATVFQSVFNDGASPRFFRVHTP